METNFVLAVSIAALFFLIFLCASVRDKICKSAHASCPTANSKYCAGADGCSVKKAKRKCRRRRRRCSDDDDDGNPPQPPPPPSGDGHNGCLGITIHRLTIEQSTLDIALVPNCHHQLKPRSDDRLVLPATYRAPGFEEDAGRVVTLKLPANITLTTPPSRIMVSDISTAPYKHAVALKVVDNADQPFTHSGNPIDSFLGVGQWYEFTQHEQSGAWILSDAGFDTSVTMSFQLEMRLIHNAAGNLIDFSLYLSDFDNITTAYKPDGLFGGSYFGNTLVKHIDYHTKTHDDLRSLLARGYVIAATPLGYVAPFYSPTIAINGSVKYTSETVADPTAYWTIVNQSGAIEQIHGGTRRKSVQRIGVTGQQVEFFEINLGDRSISNCHTPHILFSGIFTTCISGDSCIYTLSSAEGGGDVEQQQIADMGSTFTTRREIVGVSVDDASLPALGSLDSSALTRLYKDNDMKLSFGVNRIETHIKHPTELSRRILRLTHSYSSDDAGTNDLRITGNHKVMCQRSGTGIVDWVPARNISPGDTVFYTPSANASVATRSTVISIVEEQLNETAVYNLKTTQGSYFANGVLIHNKCVSGCTLFVLADGTRIAAEDIRVGHILRLSSSEHSGVKVTRVYKKRTVLGRQKGRDLSSGGKYALKATMNHEVVDLYSSNRRQKVSDMTDYPAIIDIEEPVYDFGFEDEGVSVAFAGNGAVASPSASHKVR
jgi:hypothetical protein